MIDRVSTEKVRKAKERRDRGWFKRWQSIWQGKLGSMEGSKEYRLVLLKKRWKVKKR